MAKISICVYISNRAHLYKYALESYSRQSIDKNLVELCVLDEGSSDNIMSLLDNYSDVFNIRYAQFDSFKTCLPSVNAGAGLNTLLRWMPRTPYVIKTDPEVVFKDEWLVEEMLSLLEQDDTKMYNSRCHFTEGDLWWKSYDDIIKLHERNYTVAEGGPFSRSKFYFCSGFSKERFCELGGIEELMYMGGGYDDTLLREMWNNLYGSYEVETTAQSIHLWHPPSAKRSTWEHLNKRLFDKLKYEQHANIIRIINQSIEHLDQPQWANPETLSKIYTIRKGMVINEQDINPNGSLEVSLPFGRG